MQSLEGSLESVRCVVLGRANALLSNLSASRFLSWRVGLVNRRNANPVYSALSLAKVYLAATGVYLAATGVYFGSYRGVLAKQIMPPTVDERLEGVSDQLLQP